MSTASNAARPLALLSPAVGTENVGDYFIELAIRRLLGEEVEYRRFSIRRALRAEEIDAINGCGAAVVCGTNLYQHDWESALTPEILARVKVPLIPFGVGSSAASLGERLVSETTRRMIRALHARCALGSVRDPHSLEIVSGAGVANVELTGCPVLFWARQPTLPPVLPVRRRRIVLTARNWLMHRWPDNVDHPVQIELMRRVLQSFPTDQLLYAVHEPFDERLIEILGIPTRIVVRGASVEEYLRLYTDPEYVVLAMRLHAGMLALANGVPVVFVGHDTRTYSFCEMLGIDWIELFSEGCAEACVTRLQALLNGEVDGLTPAPGRFQALREGMRRFLSANDLPACGLEPAPEATPTELIVAGPEGRP